MEADRKTYIYLVGSEYQWDFLTDSDGWTREAHQKFGDAFSSVYSKPTVELDEADYKLAISYGDPIEGWQSPSNWKGPTSDAITGVTVVDGQFASFTLGQRVVLAAPEPPKFERSEISFLDLFAGRSVVITNIEQQMDFRSGFATEVRLMGYGDDAQWLFRMAAEWMQSKGMR